jgi:hypothetical protein
MRGEITSNVQGFEGNSRVPRGLVYLRATAFIRVDYAVCLWGRTRGSVSGLQNRF